MKPFQRLLMAPVAVGMLAPVAVSAGEINLQDVDKYAGTSSADQVTSINQFSDVKPTDWAYQALSNLIERYGCVAGYPNGTYKGGQAMTRYEAAALLNACLDRITEVTDELKRLIKEFEAELAVLRGRVDGLEAKVGELQATQFSTTTKFKGQATFVVGANSFGGSAKYREKVRRPYREGMGASSDNGYYDYRYRNRSLSNLISQNEGATAFNYDLRLDFDTSFTGKDLLRTRLRAGNFAGSPWDGNYNFGYVGLNAMEVAFESGAGDDVVNVNRLFYQFPIGSNFTATFGAKVRQDDMLAVWPSVYPADTVLDIFTYAGAPGTYNLNLGGGGGIWWKSGNFSVSASYVSANSGNGSGGSHYSAYNYDDGDYDWETFKDCSGNTGGIGTSCSQQTGTFQVAYANSNFGIAAAYSYSSNGGLAAIYGGNGTPLAANFAAAAGSTSSVGISGYWQPTNSGLIPSISWGWGLSSYSSFNYAPYADGFSGGGYYGYEGRYPVGSDYYNGATSQSWYVGLQWSDVFWKGNAFGMAVGQPTFITSFGDQDHVPHRFRQDANDGNYAWEWWYKFQVTDNISVTPALFYLSAPLGQTIRSGDAPRDGGYGKDATLSNFGGLVKTTFKF